MAVRSPQDIYARHVSSSRGYPMWTPEPSSQLLSYRPEGLRIGDVGVVVPENGNFDVFFNICQPKDHPFHQATGVPDGFSPIELTDADIKTVPNVESAGQVLTASSVTRVGGDRAFGSCELPARFGQSGATGYKFNLSSNEGAVLILPEGAERHDVRDPQPFFEQASRHAATWYHFAEENLGRIISHDSIYVITGFHKARSWGLAGYQNEHGNGDFSAQFIVGAREGGNLATGYTWETTQNMDWRVGPFDGLGIPNQSVFIRGFKIALRSDVQGVPQRWVSFQPSHPTGRSNRRTSSGDSWLSNVWKGISKTIGGSNEGADRSAGSHSREDVGVRIEIQRIPEILPVFHPSDAINQYILQKEPSAKVAIIHDNVWGSILDKSLLRPEELVQDELLTKAVSERYNIVLREGVAYLQSKSLDTSVDATTDDIITTEAQIHHPESLSIVSESNYRCGDGSAEESMASESRPTDLQRLQSIPSKFAAASGPASSESLRPIKIIVISDYTCGFCYVCDKILRDAIEACRDLPIHFDVEFRPFTLVNSSTLPNNQVVYRNAYVAKKYGKEPAEMKLKALNEFAQKAGLKVADDSILCGTMQAHRLSAKAYQDGGQALQNEFNSFIFDACLARGANLSDEDVLVDASASVGLMNKEEATQFLRSTECLDCVEKMLQAARVQGINGVPFVIIDGKWAVNGLQPKECFIQIFRKLAQLPASPTVPAKSKAEHGLEVQ
ncbi:thioredoxin-like protein [Imleria badia]|nr:thioredoxin-like protein [Imleria badia]